MRKQFKPAFHPKRPTISEQDLIKRSRAAAKEVRRESFFGEVPSKPAGFNEDPIQFQLHKQKKSQEADLSYVPPPPSLQKSAWVAPPPEPEKDYRLASPNRQAQRETPEQIEERKRAVQQEKERKEQLAEKFAEKGKNPPGSWGRVSPAPRSRVIPLVLVGGRPEEGMLEDWAIHFGDGTLAELKVFTKTTPEQRIFDHTPTPDEIATKLKCSKKVIPRITKMIEDGDITMEQRRTCESDSSSKPPS
jgi:hypothetical protein